MSAPNTDVEKQEKKHKTPLLGMAAMVIFAGALLVALIVYMSSGGNEPGNDTPVGEEAATANQ